MSSIVAEEDWPHPRPETRERTEQSTSAPADAGEYARAARAWAEADTTAPDRRSARRYDDCRPANTERVVTVTEAELPVCCPPPGTCLWNSHPRVYLPLGRANGAADRGRCPYCSTQYVLADGRQGGDR